MRRRWLCYTCVFGALASEGTTADSPLKETTTRPVALLAAVARRGSVATAHIRWTVTDLVGRSANDPKARRSYETRIAGDSYVVRVQGDEHGVVRYNTAGFPAIVDSVTLLERPGDSIEYEDGDTSARFYHHRNPRTNPDIRLAGLLPRWVLGRLEDEFWKFPAQNAVPLAKQYATRGDGDRSTVTASVGNDGTTIRWEIDGTRGWDPNAVAMERKGEQLCRSASTLEQFDGVWFPRRVIYYGRDPSKPVRALEVLSATFNRPEHRKRLDPSDAGVLVGMPVEVLGRDQQGGTVVFWDGKSMASEKDFLQALKSGRIVQDPKMRALAAGFRAKNERKKALREGTLTIEDMRRGAGAALPIDPLLAEFDHRCESFAARFSSEHALDAAQHRSLRAIVTDCKQTARIIVGNRSAGDRSTTAPAHEKGAVRAGQIHDALSLLFESELVPRLSSLLRSEQLAEHPASAPTRP